MLLGRSLRDVVILMVQAILLIVAGDPVRARCRPGRVWWWCSGCWRSSASSIGARSRTRLALTLKSEDALAPLLNSVTLPLLLLSGILLPMALAPDWLQTLSSLNPLSHAVDAARALFNGQWGSPEIPIGVGLMAILAVLSVAIAARTFSRANA